MPGGGGRGFTPLSGLKAGRRTGRVRYSEFFYVLNGVSIHLHLRTSGILTSILLSLTSADLQFIVFFHTFVCNFSVDFHYVLVTKV